MIKLKSFEEIEKMKQAGKITAGALVAAQEWIKPGVTTAHIDKVIRQYIESHGAKPSFLGYAGFPGSACISINEQVIHGIPGSRKLLEGDIVKVDVGAYFKGYHGDSARTYFCGEVSPKAKDIEKVCRESFFEGFNAIKPGARLGDVSSAIEKYVVSCGYSVVKEFVGHGIGEKLHESPDVPNYGTPGRGIRLIPGMTLAIEPMINEGTEKVLVLEDQWTVVTGDNKLSAHYENTVVVTETGAEILTKI